MPGSPTYPTAGHAALRRGRVSLAGQIYLLTFTTHERIPLFANATNAMAIAPAIIDPRLWQHSRLLAWVLMPDHWHGLIQLGEPERLAYLVQRLKANSSKRMPATISQPIWARGFHDHALRREEDLLAKARYLLMNPIRAGLARSPREYPYWDAIWI